MRDGNHDSNHNTEHVVAVAAAACAVNLIAEPSIRDQQGLEPYWVRDKSREEDTAFSILKPGTVSGRFTGGSSMKGSESAESKAPETNATDEKETRPVPSFKKPLSFADQIGRTSSRKPRSSPKPDEISGQRDSAAAKPDLPAVKPESAAPKPDHPAIKHGTAATRPEQLPTIKPQAPGADYDRQTAARPGIEQTRAEAWEKAEMAKIKERYAKLNSTILAWEEKKKKKARTKLDKEEQSGSERKKARALTKFRNEMDYIKQVAEGARAEAQARQRNEELKAKEKANIIRATGELPRTCFCC
ncbi:hypothetical protein DITRI_Ditri02bG0181300 [Diplodiscus trichospermus]